MGRKSRFLTLVIALGTLTALLLGSGAGAFPGGTGLQGDDWGNDTPPYIGPTPASMGGCDTLNWKLTQNRALVAYECIPEVDITNWMFETTSMPVLSGITGGTPAPAGTPVLHVQWTVRGNIPHEGNPPPITRDLQGVSFWLYFQNFTRQNSRQTTGDLVDCRRYSHSGPFLTGNNEMRYLYWTVRLAADAQGNPIYNTIYGMGYFDPVGLVNYGTVARPPRTGVGTRCINGVATAGTYSDPGSQMSYAINGSTLDVYVPMTFHWYLGAPSFLPRDYVLAAPGDRISGVNTTSFLRLNVFSTPEIRNPIDNQQLVSPTGLAFIFGLDWSPWAAQDLGLFTPQTSAVNGPSCPYNTVPLVATAETYVQPPRGSAADTRDTDTQLNPLFGAPDGLDHYDSSLLGARTNNPIRQQDHLGPSSCNINVPGAFTFVPASGLSFVA